VSHIPESIRPIFDELSTEVTWLHARWKLYRQLFAESDKRIDMLNECASTFFFVIQDVLLGEVQVTLSKLTDPARMGKHDNLSLERLQVDVDALGALGEQALATRTRAILDDLHKACAAFRVWRNKRLAHLDLSTAMKSTSDALPGVSRKMIEDALHLVREYLNTIQRHFDDSEVGYEHFIMRAGDGAGLIAVLKAGLRYEELARQEKIGWDDWMHNPWRDA
jgi:hypothetical protein